MKTMTGDIEIIKRQKQMKTPEGGGKKDLE